MKLLLLKKNTKNPKTKSSHKGFSVSLRDIKTVVNHVHIKTPQHVWLFLQHIILKLCLDLSYLCVESYVMKLIIPRTLASGVMRTVLCKRP